MQGFFCFAVERRQSGLQGMGHSDPELERLTQCLQQQLQKPLPGRRAHQLMMPEGRGLEPLPGTPTRESAVLVPLGRDPEQRKLSVLLTVRSPTLAHHPGQLSFPGGRVKAGENYEETALREFREEVDPHYPLQQLSLVGRLSRLYIPVSFYWMQPVVAVLWQPPEFYPNDEVRQILYLPIAWLREKQNIQYGEQPLKSGKRLRYPYWKSPVGVPLWGATAMVLAELLWIYEECFLKLQ